MATRKQAASETAAETKAAKKNAKGKILIIIESPPKAKTINKFLGSEYEVLSTKGHIRDLPSSKLGVDIEHDFTPEYIVSRKDGKSAVLKEIKTAAANSSKIILATDPDREGEAIAWHLSQLLGLDPNAKNRITYNEVTKSAVTAGLANPRTIDANIVNAQQARRVLDRLVGYKLSPFLWKKVKKGLSAGRVQSVATRMIVDREREIEAFVPVEYWLLGATFEKSKKEFFASFYGDRDGKIDINDEKSVNTIIDDIKNGTFTVLSVKKQEKQKQPAPPFTTSSFQQDASSKLNIRPKRAMNIAQNLYEGVDIKGLGPVGLITYMRTDSLRVSDEARVASEKFIKDTYGSEYYPAVARTHKTKSNAQDAHEAIRPTDVTLTPAMVKDSLTMEQYRIYKLIWDRFLASQMAAAVYNTVSVEIVVTGEKSGKEYVFRASDSKIKFPGYSTIYNDIPEEEKVKKHLPELKENENLDLKNITPEQKFTQPPSRYTEGSLIKTFEENGIGRPSTYATTISTITERGYIEKEGKALKPTSLGFVTTDIMQENFNNIVDVAFTADMEKQLDEIEEGQKTYLDIMKSFYGGFAEELSEAEKKLEGVRIEVPSEESDEICEKCGARMVYKQSRYGKFLACPNYPTCKNTKSIVVEAEGVCPKCGGKLLLRRSKSGKSFYACEKGQECGFMTWDVPVKDKCPKCGSTMFKRFGRLNCLKEGCPNEYKPPVKKKKEQ